MLGGPAMGVRTEVEGREASWGPVRSQCGAEMRRAGGLGVLAGGPPAVPGARAGCWEGAGLCALVTAPPAVGVEARLPAAWHGARLCSRHLLPGPPVTHGLAGALFSVSLGIVPTLLGRAPLPSDLPFARPLCRAGSVASGATGAGGLVLTEAAGTAPLHPRTEGRPAGARRGSFPRGLVGEGLGRALAGAQGRCLEQGPPRGPFRAGGLSAPAALSKLKHFSLVSERMQRVTNSPGGGRGRGTAGGVSSDLRPLLVHPCAVRTRCPAFTHCRLAVSGAWGCCRDLGLNFVVLGLVLCLPVW